MTKGHWNKASVYMIPLRCKEHDGVFMFALTGILKHRGVLDIRCSWFSKTDFFLLHTLTHVYIYSYICIYIYIHLHTYAYRYIHTYVHTSPSIHTYDVNGG